MGGKKEGGRGGGGGVCFFFKDTATTEIYTLSLHDALPILSAEISDVLLNWRSWLFVSRRVKFLHW